MPSSSLKATLVGRKRIARLMHRAGLRGISRRKGTRTTVRDARARAAPDLVERDFTADATRSALGRGHHLHPHLGRVPVPRRRAGCLQPPRVGWSMANHLRTQLVLDALDMALWQRRPDGVIHHSDQGSQYTSLAFGKRCRDAGVRPSTGSVGIATTMRCARASSRPSNASCSSAGGSGLMPKHGWPSSSSSRAGTIHDGATPPSDLQSPVNYERSQLPPARPNHNRPRNRVNSN